jgi:hypothetical protein
MLDDVELRELRIFLAVLVAAMRETRAQRPGAGVRAGCPLPRLIILQEFSHKSGAKGGNDTP